MSSKNYAVLPYATNSLLYYAMPPSLMKTAILDSNDIINVNLALTEVYDKV